MEELAEGTFNNLLRFIGLIIRVLVWLIWNFGYHQICWYVGWPLCRLATLGQFPRTPFIRPERASTLAECIVPAVGFVSLIALGALCAQLTGSG